MNMEDVFQQQVMGMMQQMGMLMGGMLSQFEEENPDASFDYPVNMRRDDFAPIPPSSQQFSQSPRPSQSSGPTQSTAPHTYWKSILINHRKYNSHENRQRDSK